MVHHMARWSSGLRLRPLTPATRVRISYGSPIPKASAEFSADFHDRTLGDLFSGFWIKSVSMAVRVHPFPSRTRQLSSLALTILGWKRPGKIRHSYSSLAQSVEHAAVNRRVVGSSPTGGAIVGVDGGEGTPVLIPNTAVKLTCADNTWLEAAREDKQMPTQKKRRENSFVASFYFT